MPVMKKYETNKTVAKLIDNTWIINLLDMIEYGLKNNRGYRYILVVKDHFSNHGLGDPIKKSAQTTRNEFILIANCIPSLYETDDGKKTKLVDKIFTEFLNTNDVRKYTGYTYKGAVFVKRFIGTIRHPLEEPVFKKEMQNELMKYQQYLASIKITCTHQKK